MKILNRPSLVERLVLLWTDVEAEVRKNISADTKIAANDKDLAIATLDTITMAVTSRIVQQAHAKAPTLKKTETTETKTVKTTG